eukprot:Sspe_Gene.44944::Locus_22125_Transcript_2_2_Confidence_0.500_Length_15952::g.44944::m.44944
MAAEKDGGTLDVVILTAGKVSPAVGRWFRKGEENRLILYILPPRDARDKPVSLGNTPFLSNRSDLVRHGNVWVVAADHPGEYAATVKVRVGEAEYSAGLRIPSNSDAAFLGTPEELELSEEKKEFVRAVWEGTKHNHATFLSHMGQLTKIIDMDIAIPAIAELFDTSRELPGPDLMKQRLAVWCALGLTALHKGSDFSESITSDSPLSEAAVAAMEPVWVRISGHRYNSDAVLAYAEDSHKELALLGLRWAYEADRQSPVSSFMFVRLVEALSLLGDPKFENPLAVSLPDKSSRPPPLPNFRMPSAAAQKAKEAHELNQLTKINWTGIERSETLLEREAGWEKNVLSAETVLHRLWVARRALLLEMEWLERELEGSKRACATAKNDAAWKRLNNGRRAAWQGLERLEEAITKLERMDLAGNARALAQKGQAMRMMTRDIVEQYGGYVAHVDDGTTFGIRTLLGMHSSSPTVTVRDGPNMLKDKPVAHTRPACAVELWNGDIMISEPAAHSIRILRSGTVMTILGSGGGYADGVGPDARFRNPSGLLVDGETVWVADTGNHCIRLIYTDPETKQWAVRTVAGVPRRAGNAVGKAMLPEKYSEKDLAMVAMFSSPTALAMDDAEVPNLYIADTGNHMIKMLSSRIVSSVVGTPAKCRNLTLDGTLGTAQCSAPSSLCYVKVGGQGYIIFTDVNCVRAVEVGPKSKYKVTTIAGSEQQTAGVPDQGITAAMKAKFNYCQGLAFAGDRLYVTDQRNNCIRVLFSPGDNGMPQPFTLKNLKVATVLGKPQSGFKDGYGKQAALERPKSLSLMGNGCLLLTEQQRVRTVVPPETIHHLTSMYRQVEAPLAELGAEIAERAKACNVHANQVVDTLRDSRVQFLQGVVEAESIVYSNAWKELLEEGESIPLLGLVSCAPSIKDLHGLVAALKGNKLLPKAMGTFLKQSTWLPRDTEQVEGVKLLISIQRECGAISPKGLAMLLDNRSFRVQPCPPMATLFREVLKVPVLDKAMRGAIGGWIYAAIPREQEQEKLGVEKVQRGTLHLWSSFWEDYRGSMGPADEEWARHLMEWSLLATAHTPEQVKMFVRGISNGILAFMEPPTEMQGRAELPPEVIRVVKDLEDTFSATTDFLDSLLEPPLQTWKVGKGKGDDEGGDDDFNVVEWPAPTLQDLDLLHYYVWKQLRRIQPEETCNDIVAIMSNVSIGQLVAVLKWYLVEARKEREGEEWTQLHTFSRKILGTLAKGFTAMEQGQIPFGTLQKYGTVRDSLCTLWKAMGAKKSEEVLSVNLRDASHMSLTLQNLAEVGTAFFDDHPLSGVVADFTQSWQSKLICEGKSLLRRGPEVDGAAPLPTALLDNLEWLYSMAGCCIFRRLWEKSPFDHNVEQRIEAVSAEYRDVYMRLQEESITFEELADYADAVLTGQDDLPRLDSDAVATKNIKGQIDLFVRAVPQPDEKGVLVRNVRPLSECTSRERITIVNTEKALLAFTRLSRVLNNQTELHTNLDLLGNWVRPAGMHTVEEEKQALKHMATRIEEAKEGELKMANIQEFFFTPHAEVIIAISYDLLVTLRDNIVFLQWLSEQVSELDFSSAIEMALGRPEMECPPDLWVDDGSGPGHVDETKLSQLASIRKVLHNFLFSSENLQFKSLAEVATCFGSLPPEAYSTTASTIREVAPFYTSLRELLAEDGDASAINRLHNLHIPEWNGRWVIDGTDPEAPVAVFLEYCIPRKSGVMTARQNLNEMLDFQSAVVLARGTEEDMALIQSFVACFGWVRELAAAHEALRAAGHPQYQMQRVELPVASLTELSLHADVVAARSALEGWEEEVKGMRERVPALNFFTLRQLLRVEASLKSGEGLNEITDELRECAFPGIELDVIQGALRSAWGAGGVGESGAVFLKRAESALQSLAAHVNTRMRWIAAEQSGMVTERPLQVVITDQVVPAALSQFVRAGLLPEWDTLLWAAPDTELEVIENHLRRWALSPKSPRIFCVAGIDNIAPAHHKRVVSTILELLPTASHSLVLIASLRDHFIVRQLMQWRIAATVQAASSLKQIGTALSKTRQLQIFTSDYAGSGKTFAIRREAARNGYQVVHVPMHSDLTREGLIAFIEQRIPRTHSQYVLHLDLSDSLPASMEDLLCELLVAESIYDAKCGRRWFLPRSAVLYVEAAPTVPERIALMGMLPNVKVHTGRDEFVADEETLECGMGESFRQARFDGTSFTAGVRVGANAFVRLQYVSSALKTREEVCGFPLVFEPEGELKASECYDLLIRTAQLPLPVSMWAMWSFVDVAYWLLKSAFTADSPLRSLLSTGDFAINGKSSNEVCLHKLRGEAAAFLCRTATDFATRQRRQRMEDVAWVRMDLVRRSNAEVIGTDKWYFKRTQFDCDGRPVFRMGEIMSPTYLYYQGPMRFMSLTGVMREASSETKWVVSTIVAPNAPVVYASSGQSLNGEWVKKVEDGTLTEPSVTLLTNAQMREESPSTFERGIREGDVYCRDEPFGDLRSWNEANHEALLINKKTGAVKLLAINPFRLRRRMHPLLLEHFEKHGISIGGELHRAEQHYPVLSALTGVVRDEAEAAKLLGGSYCMTGDVVLKILATLSRVRCGVPVVLMGECGCGKTHMLRYVCAWLGAHLVVLDVHGGTTEEDIYNAVDEAKSTGTSGEAVFLFLDEVNTCAHMGLITEIIVGRSVGGKPLPPNLYILAACNPYRRRTELQTTSGLTYKAPSRKDAPPDPLADLVYRVHPIPRRLHEFIFDFGSLEADTESKYVHSMVQSVLPAAVDSWVIIRKMLLRAQAYVRKAEGDPSCVSLRDLRRALTLVKWFHKFSGGKGREGRNAWSAPTVLGLSHVFYFRLPRDELRAGLLTEMRLVLSHREDVGGWDWLFAAGEMHKLIRSTMSGLCSKLAVEEGIAMNQSLMENLYVTMICVFNRIPVFVVGKPGSSKTLTLQVLASNLRGAQSDSEFWKKFPAVYIFPYQCSPLSTAAGIRHQFEIACNYQKKASRTIVILLLDEVGLAEHSPDMPLKVLHGILVKPPIAIVGLSNWTLDAAKMNRAICLQRPEPEQDDVYLIGKHILGSAKESSKEKEKKDTWLTPLSSAYHRVYTTQSGREFLGMRDYYQTVKLLRRETRLSQWNGEWLSEGMEFLTREVVDGVPIVIKGDVHLPALFTVAEVLEGKTLALVELQDPIPPSDIVAKVKVGEVLLRRLLSHGELQHRLCTWSPETPAKDVPGEAEWTALNQRRAYNSAQPVSPALLSYVLCRNFAGKPDLVDTVLTTFGKACFANEASLRPYTLPSVAAMAANLLDSNARHLMVLTRNGAALPLLFSTGLLDKTTTPVLIGSTFRDDEHELHMVQQVNKVKMAMAAGRTVVLVNHDNIYESLYDVLNQRYVTRSIAGTTRVRKMLRLAIGARSQLCPVADGFRIVVVAEQSHAYDNLDLPLLNRFEKQVLFFTDCLAEHHRKHLAALDEWSTSVHLESRLGSMGSVFFGFYDGTLPSLALTANPDAPFDEEQERLRKVLSRLAHPVAVLQSMGLRRECPNYMEQHSGLVSIFRCIMAERRERSVNDSPLLLQLFTSSAVAQVTKELLAVCSEFEWGLVGLAELSSEALVTHEVETHFKAAAPGVLVVQCDPVATPQAMIDHARWIVEQTQCKYPTARNRHVVFTIHVPPGARNRSRKYDVDLSNAWRACFVDDVREMLDTSTIDRLMQVSLVDAASQGLVDLAALVQKRIPSALSLLVCPAVETQPVPSYVERVRMIQDRVKSDREVCTFLTDLVCLILDRHSSPGASGLHLHVSLALGELAAGSLRTSIDTSTDTLVTQALSQVLRHLDADYNLYLLLSDKELWLELSKLAGRLDSIGVTSPLDGTLQALEVANHGARKPLVASFPFSHALAESLEALREPFERTGYDFSTIPRRWKTFAGETVSQLWNDTLAQRYFADYLSIKGMVPHERLYRIILNATHPLVWSSPLAIHAASWKSESRLFYMHSILDTFPPQVCDSILKGFERKMTCEELDQAFVQAVVVESWRHLERMETVVEWVTWTQRTFPSIALDIAYFDLGAVQKQWELLRLLHLFAQSVLLPVPSLLEATRRYYLPALRGIKEWRLAELLQIFSKAPTKPPEAQCSRLLGLFIREYVLQSGDEDTVDVMRIVAGLPCAGLSFEVGLPTRRVLLVALLQVKSRGQVMQLADSLKFSSAEEKERLFQLFLEVHQDVHGGTRDGGLMDGDVAIAKLPLPPLTPQGVNSISSAQSELERIAGQLVNAVAERGDSYNENGEWVRRPPGHAPKFPPPVRRLLETPQGGMYAMRKVYAHGGANMALEVLMLGRSCNWFFDFNRAYAESCDQEQHIPDCTPLLTQDPAILEELAKSTKGALSAGATAQATALGKLKKSDPRTAMLALFSTMLSFQPSRNATQASEWRRWLAELPEIEPPASACLKTMMEAPCRTPAMQCVRSLRFHMLLIAMQANSLPADQRGTALVWNLVNHQVESLKDMYVPGCAWASEMQTVMMGMAREHVTWYKCPNGHLYTIGECGGAMESRKCTHKGCNALIGGQNHVSAAGNRRIGTMYEHMGSSGDIFKPGLRQPEEGELIIRPKHTVSPMMGLSLQIMVYLLMSLARTTAVPQSKIERVLLGNLGKLQKHTRLSLSELLIIFHTLIEVVTPLLLNHHCTTLTDACDFEIKAENAMYRVMGNRGAALATLSQAVPLLSSSQDLIKLENAVGEQGLKLLLERPVPKEKRISPIWRMRTQVSFGHFVDFFKSHSSHLSAHPLLAALVEHEGRISLIKYLADILEWHQILGSVYADGTLSRSEAANTPASSVLQKLHPADAKRGEEALRGYCEAFNRGMPFLPNLYECQRNPFLNEKGEADLSGGNEYHPVKMTPDAPLTFSLPSMVAGEVDAPGLCTIQLSTLFHRMHNEIVEMVAKVLPSERPEVVIDSSTNPRLTRKSLIVYDREADLIPLLFEFKMQPLEEGKGGDLEYDLAGLEQAIAHGLLGGKLPVRLRMKHFLFAGEVRQRGGLAALQRVEQSGSLPPVLEEAIKNDLDTQEQLAKLLRVLESAINFAAASGIKLDPDMRLHDYLSTTLLLDDMEIRQTLSVGVQRHGLVRHLRALFLFAEACMSGSGVMDRVAVRYTESLPDGLRDVLHDSAPKLELSTVLSALRELLTGPLSANDVSFPAGENLKEFLLYQDMDLGDEAWYNDYFPDDLELRHALATFDVLSNKQS